MPNAAQVRYDALLADPVARAAYLRTRSVGGSQVGAVLGVSPWAGPADVYDAVYGIAPVLATEPAVFRRGARLEPLVVEELRRPPVRYARLDYRAARGPDVHRLVHRRLASLTGTPDALAVRVEDDLVPPRRRGVVEIKVVGRDVFDGLAATGAAPGYVAQVLAYLACDPTLAWGDLVYFSPDRWALQVFAVPRDPVAIAGIEAAVARFWDTYVVPGRRPPSPASSSPAPTLALPVLGGRPATALRDDAAWQAAVTVLAADHEALATATARYEASKGRVQALMGDLTHVRWAGGAISWNETSRETVDLAALREAAPDVVAAATRTTWVRAFRPSFR